MYIEDLADFHIKTRP